MPNKSFIAAMSPERLLLARIFQTVPTRMISSELNRRAQRPKTAKTMRLAA